STPGCGCEPGPHGTSGVATKGGSARLTTGAGANDSPAPCPSAKRSLSGSSWPYATAAAIASAATTAATAATRTPRPSLGRPQPAGHAVDEPDEGGVQGGPRPRRAPEGALGADRAPPAAPAHVPGITVVGERVKVAARRAAEHRDERLGGELRHLPHRGQA